MPSAVPTSAHCLRLAERSNSQLSGTSPAIPCHPTVIPRARAQHSLFTWALASHWPAGPCPRNPSPLPLAVGWRAHGQGGGPRFQIRFCTQAKRPIKPSVKAGKNFFVKCAPHLTNALFIMASVTFTPPYTPPYLAAVSTGKIRSHNYLVKKWLCWCQREMNLGVPGTCLWSVLVEVNWTRSKYK